MMPDLGFLSLLIWPSLLLLTTAYLLRPKPSPFPTANNYPLDFLNRKAYRDVRDNPRNLITTSLAKFKSPFTLAIPHGRKILLPASLADWVKSNKNLDHRQLVREDFFADIPGFEAQAALQAADDTVLNVIKTKLGQNNSTMGAMNESLAVGLRETWGEGSEWHAIEWYRNTMELIARAASSVFVGPEKAGDREWLDLVQGYVMAYFGAVGELHRYPRWSRGIMHWFLPNAIACRTYVPRARSMMREVLEKRREEVRKAEREGVDPPQYNDALSWVEVSSGGRAEPGDIQLSLAMAALFTTSEAFRQVLIDVARHPGLVEELRNEVSQQVSEHGISITATANMVLLDSVMKESQRLSSGPVVLERAALVDTPLPDGKVIPRGSHIMVDSTGLWDPSVYPNPDQYDGHRFLRKRNAGDKSSQFVQSGSNFHVFGGGRHICPGRFFAGNELKLALTHILLKYDIRLGEGCDPKPIHNGFYTMVDPTVQLEVRRREGGDILHV